MPKKNTKVLVVEDEIFVQQLIADGLRNEGYKVETASDISSAIEIIENFDPHVVMTDLDFGGGPDGADLLNRVHEEKPWMGMIVLTAHSSPELAVRANSRIPSQAIYLVKSDLTSLDQLYAAVKDSISNSKVYDNPVVNSDGKFVLSASQCEILKYMAEGLSNTGIAAKRNVSLRATESLIQRTFQALEVKNDPNLNSRILAVRLWQQGKVVVG